MLSVGVTSSYIDCDTFCVLKVHNVHNCYCVVLWWDIVGVSPRCHHNIALLDGKHLDFCIHNQLHVSEP